MNEDGVHNSSQGSQVPDRPGFKFYVAVWLQAQVCLDACKARPAAACL